MKKILFVFLSLVFSINCLRSEDHQTMLTTLDAISIKFNISFTIEFLTQKDSPQECWRSIVISKYALPKDQDVLEWNIQRLEKSLPGWVVVPSAEKAVFHCIDRQLLLRSPLDETLSKISYTGPASDLFISPKFPHSMIHLPQMFGSNSGLGGGSHLTLSEYSGRVRDSITKTTSSLETEKNYAPSIQWIAECRDQNSINATLYFPVTRMKYKEKK